MKHLWEYDWSDIDFREKMGSLCSGMSCRSWYDTKHNITCNFINKLEVSSGKERTDWWTDTNTFWVISRHHTIDTMHPGDLLAIEERIHNYFNPVVIYRAEDRFNLIDDD